MSDFVKFYLTPILACVLVANPKTYEMTRSVLGSWVASQDGLAKTGGLILHAIVFILLVSLLMRLLGGVSYARHQRGDRPSGGYDSKRGDRVSILPFPMKGDSGTVSAFV